MGLLQIAAGAMRLGLLAEKYVAGSEISVETFVEQGKPLFHNCTEYLHQWKKSVVPANPARYTPLFTSR